MIDGLASSGRVAAPDEKESKLPQSVVDWVGLLSSICTVLLYIQTAFGRKKATSSSNMSVIPFFLLTIITVITTGFGFYDRHYLSSASTELLTSEGVKPPSFFAIADGHKLQDYAGKYKAMLIVAAPYTDTDPMTDPNIVKSTLYTIIDGPVQMATIDMNLSRYNRFGPTTIIYHLAIMPNDSNPNNIGGLQDVLRLGGKLLYQVSYNGPFVPMVAVPKQGK